MNYETQQHHDCQGNTNQTRYERVFCYCHELDHTAEPSDRLRNHEGKERVEIVGEISVDGTRERGDEAMKELQGTEVELDPESSPVHGELPEGSQPLHGLQGTNEQNPFPRNRHVLFQPLRDVSGVSDEKAKEILVDRPEEVPVVRSGEGEEETEEPAICISRQSHFEAVVPAF